MREKSGSPKPLCERTLNCPQRPVVTKPAKCTLRDSVETKENSAVKTHPPQDISPIIPRKLDFQETSSAPKPIRRSRVTASTHQEKRFKGSQLFFPKMALELHRPETQTSEFFRCFQERQIASGLPTPPDSTQDDDCATDEESADTMRTSLLEVLSATILAQTK